MRILTLSTLYPNAAMPVHGVFVETRLRHYLSLGAAEARVVAPVPWFPFGHPAFGKYGAFGRAPRSEFRAGIQVDHPRYFLPPKVGMTYASLGLDRCFEQAAREIEASGWSFDLIDAHYLYPDGVAAARAARVLGKPYVLTARGSDVTLIPDYPRQKRMILKAICDSETTICVADALKEELVRLGAPREKLATLRNGVDLERFQETGRDAMRERLGVSGPLAVSVGHLIDRKGHDIAIRTVRLVEDLTLLIIGDGPEHGALRRLAESEGVADRVLFQPPLEQSALAQYYAAADALILASSREGWPNVLLEAMACGTPAVAAPVWGCGEVIRSPDAGMLAEDRTPEAFASAVKAVLARGTPRGAVRAYAEGFSWEETARGLDRLFCAVKAKAERTAAIRQAPLPLRGPKDPPRLLVTVDTEEAFDWAEFDELEHEVCRPADIDRFQAISAAEGAAPVYFMTYPLLRDPGTADYVRSLVLRGDADAGLHLHHWTTPPTGGFVGDYYSWQMNLPPEVQAAKLRSLMEAYQGVFGRPPVAHRAGRYGIRLDSYAALAATGLTYDFSPSPAFDFHDLLGPDFSDMSAAPFSVLVPGGKQILVTPVSGAWGLRGGARFRPQKNPPGFPRSNQIRPRSLMSPLRLSPEGASVEEMKALVRHLHAERIPAITFSIHSTSMTPRANPYVGDADAVDRMLDRCRTFFRAFRTELGGEFIRLADLSEIYAEPAADSFDTPPGPTGRAEPGSDVVNAPLRAQG